jgi:hypothetical protein
MSTLCMPLLSFGFAVAGCDSCPASVPITLGDGTTQVASDSSGPASFANSKWAFHASALPAPLTFQNTLIPEAGELLFRMEFGAQGQALRVYDNQVIGPADFGPQIILDRLTHPMTMPSLTHASSGYVAESGAATGVATCSTIYSQPFSVVKVHVSFSGTEDLLLNRTSGVLRFVTEVNPMFASLVPPNVKSESVEVPGYAVREN